jgi:hypothetical protein
VILSQSPVMIFLITVLYTNLSGKIYMAKEIFLKMIDGLGDYHENISSNNCYQYGFALYHPVDRNNWMSGRAY